MAVSMMLRPPSGVATDAALATAVPPAATISSTTACAAEEDAVVPSTAAPTSLTTTCAPRRANSKAWHRPNPPPAPVITATRPSNRNGSIALHSLCFGATEVAPTDWLGSAYSGVTSRRRLVVAPASSAVICVRIRGAARSEQTLVTPCESGPFA